MVRVAFALWALLWLAACHFVSEAPLILRQEQVWLGDVIDRASPVDPQASVSPLNYVASSAAYADDGGALFAFKYIMSGDGVDYFLFGGEHKNNRFAYIPLLLDAANRLYFGGIDCDHRQLTASAQRFGIDFACDEEMSQQKNLLIRGTPSGRAINCFLRDVYGSGAIYRLIDDGTGQRREYLYGKLNIGRDRLQDSIRGKSAACAEFDDPFVTDCDAYAASDIDPSRKGQGIPFDKLDPVKAVATCEDALRSYPAAARFQYQLGRSYERSGRTGEAAGWYRKAAESGYAAAQFGLADLYASGRGVPVNQAEAIAWYRRAADQGLDAAKAALDSRSNASGRRP